MPPAAHGRGPAAARPARHEAHASPLSCVQAKGASFVPAKGSTSEGSSLEAGQRLYARGVNKLLAEEAMLSSTDIEVAQECTFYQESD